MTMPRALIIACRQIEKELEALLVKTACRAPVLYLPRELHLSPDKLRVYLLELLGRISNVDFVLLPTGQCGNGTVGIVSPHASLVLPRCSDCIDILLSMSGGQPALRPTDSFFLTDSWLEGEHSVLAEYEYAKKKYEPDQVESIMEMCYGNYRYFTFVDTGAYDVEPACERIREMAAAAEMEIDVRRGECALLEKMLRSLETGDFDDDFLVLPPGVEVSQKHYLS